MAEKIVLDENNKQILLNSIRSINDFPKAGIVFKDVTTLLNNKINYIYNILKYWKNIIKS